MKTHLTSILILAAALSTSAFSAAQKNSVPLAFPVTKVALENAQIKSGTTALTVLRLLGTPTRKLSPDTWVYFNFQADPDLAATQGCNTLIVNCTGGEVTGLQLVNDRAVDMIAANLQPELRVKQVASNK